MRFLIVAVTLLSAGLLAAPASGQTQPATASITRSLIAETRLSITGNVPLYFRALGIIVPANETSSFSAPAEGILYEVSGSTAATVGGEAKELNPQEGLFVAAGKQVVLKAVRDMPSTLLHFILSRTADLDQPEAAVPATTIEVFRTPNPIPGLKAGMYDLNLTLVTFPPHTPPISPQRRSGAALYYVLSGTGENLIEGGIEAMGVGSMIYETPHLIHEWGNPGDEPLSFLVFNITRGGLQVVVPDAPANRGRLHPLPIEPMGKPAMLG
jgi:quercetin dioxygenase-like cupin family protein